MKYFQTLEEIINTTRSLERYTNRNNFTIKQITPQIQKLKKIDKRNAQFIETPQNVWQLHRGFCYDQSFLISEWLNHLNIKNNIYFSITNNLEKQNNIYIYTPKVVSHALVIYQFNNKFKWLQWSWIAQINNNINQDTLEQALLKYKNMAEKSWHMPIILTDVTNIKLGISKLDFLNKALEKQHIFG